MSDKNIVIPGPWGSFKIDFKLTIMKIYCLFFLDIVAASIGLKYLELWKYLTDNQQNLSTEEQGELICKVHKYYIGSYIKV